LIVIARNGVEAPEMDTWEYRVFVPLNNRSTESIQRVKRRVVADQIGRTGRILGAYAHTDALAGKNAFEFTEATKGYNPRVHRRVERDSGGAELWSTTLSTAPIRPGPLTLKKQTERYMLGGCIAEMSLLGLPSLDEEAQPQQYVTFCFQGPNSFTVYEAAEAAGLPSLAAYALCGDREASTILGAMGMSYAGFIEAAPHLGAPAVISATKVRRLEEAQRVSSAADGMTAAGAMPELSSVSPQVLQRYLHRLFALADTDNSGDLDYSEFSKFLRSSGFNLDRGKRRSIMAAVEVNAQGRISYADFVPVCMEILGVPLRSTMAANKGTKSLDLASVSSSTMEAYLKRLFAVGDTNQDGVLSPDELDALLRKSGFQFTDAVITEIIQVCDINHDGVIEYDEFVPMMTQILCS